MQFRGEDGRNSSKALYSGPEFLIIISRPNHSGDKLELDPPCWPGSSNKIKVLQ